MREDAKELAPRKKREPPADGGRDSSDGTSWEALRECRRQLAAEQNVPPYVIFHDATLRQMLAERARGRGPRCWRSAVSARRSSSVTGNGSSRCCSARCDGLKNSRCR